MISCERVVTGKVGFLIPRLLGDPIMLLFFTFTFRLMNLMNLMNPPDEFEMNLLFHSFFT